MWVVWSVKERKVRPNIYTKSTGDNMTLWETPVFGHRISSNLGDRTVSSVEDRLWVMSHTSSLFIEYPLTV